MDGRLILLLFVVATSADYIIDDYLKTPFGYWHKDCVYEVPSGSILTNHDKHMTITTPNGTSYSNPRCIHGIQNQQEIMHNLGLTSSDVNGSGWQVYVKYNARKNISNYYQSNWRVPIEPKKDGQIIYNFLMMQNMDWYPPQPPPNEPVDSILTGIQFGKTTAGGTGTNWGTVNWYQSLSQDLYHSKVQTAYYYDVLWAYLNRTGSDSWHLAIDDNGIFNQLTIQNSSLTSLPWIYIALNVYDVISCDQYPQIGKDCIEPYPPCNEMPYVNIYLDDPYKQIPWIVGKGQDPPICDATIATRTVADPTDDVYITF